jgi:hypothetical protein
VSSIGLHGSALGWLSVVLGIAAPGMIVGGVIGALAWPSRRVAGALLGGGVGAVIGALLLTIGFGIRLPMGF